jgi:hypothetical protein
MSLRTALAAVAVLALATPVFAQTAPAADPVAETAGTEAAFEARGEAFGARMQGMGTEMQAAVTAAGADQAKARADLDAIVARYQPEADAFAAEFETFFAAQMAAAPEAQRAAMSGMAPTITAQIKGVPAMVRGQVEQAAAAAPATSQ